MFSLYILLLFINIQLGSLSPNENLSDKLVVLSSGSNPNLNDLKAWIKFHKESGKVDTILGKCYECIRDKSRKEDGE
jgi:hypothetical protein